MSRPVLKERRTREPIRRPLLKRGKRRPRPLVHLEHRPPVYPPLPRPDLPKQQPYAHLLFVGAFIDERLAQKTWLGARA